jgi:hypothetical protein
MSKLYIFIFSLFLLLSCQKDNISSLQSDYFIKFYGNSGADIGYDVIQSSDGGYVFIGSTENVDNDDYGTDIFIIKTDKYGNKKWQSEYIGDTLDDVGKAIYEIDNSFYFVGTNEITDSNSDIILGKIDNNGNIDWTKNIGGPGIQEGNNFIIDNENNIIIVGNTNIVTTPASSAGDTLPNNLSNIFALKTNSSGDSITSYSMPGNMYDDNGQDIIQNADGNYIIIGNSISYSIDKTIYQVMVIELPYNFTIPLRFVATNTISETKVQSILLSNDQNMYFIGSQVNGSNTDIYASKINTNLSGFEWGETYGNVNNDIGYGIIECANGLAIVGTSNSVGEFGNGNNDIYFQKIDAGNGAPLETEQLIGGTGNEEGRMIYGTSDDGFIIVGVNNNAANSDIALIKTDNSGLIK